MRFVPYDELGNEPNVIVDGARQDATVLSLSHWPRSGTPPALLRDTSAEIVFAYLDDPAHHVDVDAASNNHFDEDGLIGLFALLNPEAAGAHRELLIDTASAGDFGVYSDPRAARICFTIAAHAHTGTSPLDAAIFALPYPAMTAALYPAMLERLPDIVENTDAYEAYWRGEEQRLQESERLVADGTITIEEQPELDLAVVRLPAELAGQAIVDRSADPGRACHDFAIYPATRCNRVLVVCDRIFEFRYRYESWVQYVSYRPPPRVDLSSLALELNEMETAGGTWQADGVDQITPRLRLAGVPASDIPEETFVNALTGALAGGAPAWDPYA